MVPKNTKLFVLDTNVILHDSACLHQFKEHDVVVPIAVIEELDKFKKGNESINFHARHFLKEIDKLSSEGIFNGGVPIGPKKGMLSIRLDQRFSPDLRPHFEEGKVDHKILNTAYCLAKENPGREVTLVTKDVNLRMKAKAVQLRAEDYKTDYVKDISTIYKGYRFEENVSRDLINKLCHDTKGIPTKSFRSRSKFLPNEFIVARNQNMSALGFVDPEDMMIKHITKISASGIKPRNVEQMFALHALMNEDIRLVTVSGKAGTGKTLLALAAALEMRDNYKQIFLARPIVALSNRDIGYLPGRVDEKIGPSMQPLYDNLGVIQDRIIENPERRGKKFQKLLDEEKLVISGFLAQMLGFGALAFSSSLSSLLTVSTIGFYGMGVLRPALTSLVTQRASRREQGAVLGATQSLMSIAQILSPILAGYLIHRGWLAAWALAAAGASLCGLLATQMPFLSGKFVRHDRP